jgi:hypothetical protein
MTNDSAMDTAAKAGGKGSADGRKGRLLGVMPGLPTSGLERSVESLASMGAAEEATAKAQVDVSGVFYNEALRRAESPGERAEVRQEFKEEMREQREAQNARVSNRGRLYTLAQQAGVLSVMVAVGWFGKRLIGR